MSKNDEFEKYGLDPNEYQIDPEDYDFHPDGEAHDSNNKKELSNRIENKVYDNMEKEGKVDSDSKMSTKTKGTIYGILTVVIVIIVWALYFYEIFG